MSRYADTDDGCAISGGEMLARIAVELSQLAVIGTDVQVAVSTVLNEAQMAGRLDTLQGLDLITQTLEALALVVAAFQAKAPSLWQVMPEELSRDVTLGALQQRLLGHASVARVMGEVDLW